MNKILFAILCAPFVVMAQETVAPTIDERVGSPRGENKGDYNVRSVVGVRLPVRQCRREIRMNIAA